MNKTVPSLFVAAVLASSLSAGNPGNEQKAEPRTSISETEPVSVDLAYKGTVGFLPEKGEVSADLFISVSDSEATEISFLLNNSVGEAEVTGPQIQSVANEVTKQFNGLVRTYRIKLAPQPSGEPREIRFRYSGQLMPEGAPLEINSIEDRRIELTVDSFWFPFEAGFDSTIAANLDISVEGEWTGVAPGRIEQTEAGFRLVQHEQGLDISLALLKDPVVRRSGPYAVYDGRTFPGGNSDLVFEALEGCTNFLNALAGPQDILPSAQVIINDRDSGGYSRRTMIALTDVSDTPKDHLVQFVCHELAHNWSVANAGGPENWHNEGFADALANLGLRELVGNESYEARLERYREALRKEEEKLGPIWTPESTARPSFAISYRAGPLGFAALEGRIGSQKFRKFAQTIMNSKIATTPAMLEALERVAGGETRQWFEGVLATEATELQSL